MLLPLQRYLLSLTPIVLVGLIQTPGIAQVSSPNENSPSIFTDVSPSDWSYPAIQRLVERGCLTGYADGNFRGEDTLSRNEFAAAMALCLDSVVEDAVPPGDINELQRLQQNLQQQLTCLSGDVAQLETDTGINDTEPSNFDACTPL
ncbi:MAG: S-layer homology domain-containing protein [Cyanobacteria bacterium P01_D01_bin.128]